MQELFRTEWGNPARSSENSLANFFGRLFRLAALELVCFYNDEVLIEGLQFGVGEAGEASEDCAAYDQCNDARKDVSLA